MNIVFFAHPVFLGSESMPRFVNMLVQGMQRRGWSVKIFCPRAYFYRIRASRYIRKWLGYIDQYVLFPLAVRRKLRDCEADTLFVFTDQALGLWVHLVADRCHVIHCHDFLAQQSAKGLIRENGTAWFGRQYQALIRRGYARGRHFISVSEKTRDDLHTFLSCRPLHSEVVYNGLNQRFEPHDPTTARVSLSVHLGVDLKDGYILHVGGNQWNKNRVGVIEIYDAWRARHGNHLPLILIGEAPDQKLTSAYEGSKYRGNIYIVIKLEDEWLPAAYSGASVFLFPSVAEGFGWPIAEAMACGCPVITTHAAPMTEVAGDAGFLIPARPFCDDHSRWAMQAAKTLNNVLTMSDGERAKAIEAGLQNAKRFETESALDRIETIYKRVIDSYARHDVGFSTLNKPVPQRF